MAKDKTAYVCSACGYDSPKWIGKCPACGEWNTFQEVKLGKTSAALRFSEGKGMGDTASPLLTMSQIQTVSEPRINLFDNELNRVLGGGLVPGSLVLLGGEPGIGKSTLILQTVLRLRGKHVLYVSGEESARQLKLRADRITDGNQVAEHVPNGDGLLVACESMIENIFKHIEASHPDLIVIDSIQTIALKTWSPHRAASPRSANARPCC